MRVEPGGRFEAREHTIEDLARVAYGFEELDPRQTVERPWFFPMGQDVYDITAVSDREWTTPPPGEAVPLELRSMLRVLLEDRFQLRARIEDRTVDVYALRLARSHGELGPGVRPSRTDCLGPFAPAPADDAAARCPFRIEPDVLQVGAVTMSELARILPRIHGSRIDRVIVDGTGLEGAYDVLLTMEPGRAMSVTQGELRSLDQVVLDAGPSALLADRRAMAIHAAIEEQLGLRLAKTRLSIPVLIIEGAKRPVED